MVSYIPRKSLKYWKAIYSLSLQNLAQKFRRYVYFMWFFSQIPKISNFCRAINFCRRKVFNIWGYNLFFWVKNKMLFFCRTVKNIIFFSSSVWSQNNCWCLNTIYDQKYLEERQNQNIRVLIGEGALTCIQISKRFN